MREVCRCHLADLKAALISGTDVSLQAFKCQRQGASADKLQVKAAKILPLVGLPDPSKTQSTMGMVLSIHNAPGSRALTSIVMHFGVKAHVAWLY